ncbi:arginine--tRNA ligase [Candidatus Thorarchaeota archaeon]|nr:MAG: arginine--tRNA ligase [Candidatus Thorarchaeota archaeon]
MRVCTHPGDFCLSKMTAANPWEFAERTVVKILAKSASVEIDRVSSSIEIPPDSSLGDMASTLAFIQAKNLKKNPTSIAAEMLPNLEILVQKEPLIGSVRVKGPYINIFLDRGAFAIMTLSSVLQNREYYGKSLEFQGRRALIEFPAVNPSKPWHIGHARNAILGDTLSNILEAVGYEVIRLDYINDLGLQIAQLIWKLKQVKDQKPEGKYDHYLGHLYVQVQEAFDSSEEVQKEVREVSRNLEDLESADAKLSATMVDACVKAQYETGYRLGVFHDYQVWESAIAHSGLLDKAREMILQCDNITKLETGEKAGCIVADLSVIDEFKDMKDPYKILFRSDGTRTYTGADVALQLWKFGVVVDPFGYDLFDTQPNNRKLLRTSVKGKKIKLGKFDVVLNVIASRQAHPQKMVYTVLDLMGYKKESENSHHIAYEYVGLEGEDFSGRHGTWIGYSTDEVLDKTTELAKIEVDKRNPEEKDELKDIIANQVASGALRYFMLNASPDRKITFKWEEALDFQGDASPYLQYSLARANRILEKVEYTSNETANLNILVEDAEFELVKAIARFPQEVLEVVRSMKKDVWGTSFASNKITAFGYRLATLFSKFYDSCPVLKAEPEMKEARLALVDAFRTTMANCLTLLGIPVVERM